MKRNEDLERGAEMRRKRKRINGYRTFSGTCSPEEQERFSYNLEGTVLGGVGRAFPNKLVRLESYRSFRSKSSATAKGRQGIQFLEGGLSQLNEPPAS
jgi:hypothetical protein